MQATQERPEGQPGQCTPMAACRRWGLAWLLLAVLGSQTVATSQGEPRDSVDDVMASVQEQYGQSGKAYDKLAKRVEKAVRAAVDSRVWLAASGAGSEKRFKDHPGFAMIRELSDAARSDAKKRSKNSGEMKALLKRYPWDEELELIQGLAHGSDRPVPKHNNGFIYLGRTDPFPGFPDLPINQYLYGLDEIVGWQYRVKEGKKLSFGGRSSKDKPVIATKLSSWEAIRVALEGVRPDVPLFGVPWMTHRLHSRITERRRDVAEGREPMDELLALLDSQWNGFYFEPPWSKKPMAIVQPVHELYANRKGFVYQFPDSTRLESVGDIPFISDQTLELYAETLLDQRIGPAAFIARTPEAVAAKRRFQSEITYLTRYKWLVDEVVWAIVAPTSPYPGYLGESDYRQGAWPGDRAMKRRFAVPRKYAVVLWAWSEKDPDRLADFLWEHLLSQEAHQFPSDVPLQHLLVDVVRKREAEMMEVIVARIQKDRGDGGLPGDYEREFSPFPDYLTTEGKPKSDHVMHSFQSFHEEAAEVVREAAYSIVVDEVQ